MNKQKTWGELYEELCKKNSYQGKLEKENKKLQTKLDKITAIMDSDKAELEKLDAIQEVLYKE